MRPCEGCSRMTCSSVGAASASQPLDNYTPSHQDIHADGLHVLTFLAGNCSVQDAAELTVCRSSVTPKTMVAFSPITGNRAAGSGLKLKVQSTVTCFPVLSLLCSVTECSVKSSLQIFLAKYATTRSFSLPVRRIGGASQSTSLWKTWYAYKVRVLLTASIDNGSPGSKSWKWHIFIHGRLHVRLQG